VSTMPPRASCSRRRPVAFFLAAISVALLCTAAESQPQTTKAEEDFQFASGLFNRQMYELAAEKYIAFAQAYPNDANVPLALFRAGECYFKLDQTDKALDVFGQVVTRYPQAPEAVHASYRTGELKFKAGDYDAAIAAFGRVLAGQPDATLRAGAEYWTAESLYDKGQFGEAIPHYQASLQAAPNGPFAAYAAYSIALCNLEAGNLDAAREFFNRVLTDFPESEVAAEASYRLGDVLYAQGDYDAAAAQYRKTAEGSPDSPFALRARYGIAWCAYQQKDYEGAMQRFRELGAQTADPGLAAEAKLHAADCLFHLGKFEEAAAGYAVVEQLGVAKVAPDAAFWRANALARLDRLDEAAQALEAMIQKYPDSELIPDAYLALGDVRVRQKALDGAQQAYQAARDKATDAGDKARAAYGLAWVAYERDPSPEAADALAQALADVPLAEGEGARALQIAALQQAKGDHAAASKTLEDFLAQNANSPDAAEAYYRLGQSKLALNDPPGAERALRTVLDRFPNSPFRSRAAAALAKALAAQGKADEAQQVLAGAPAQAGDNTVLSAQFEIAQSLLDAGKFEEARKQFEGIVASNPPGPLMAAARFGIGVAHMQTNQWQEAAAQFQQAAAADPQGDNAPPALFNRGVCLEKQGDFAGAAAAYQALADGFPNHEQAGRARLRQAVCLLQENQAEQAKPILKAVAAGGDAESAATALFHLGEIAFAAEQYDAALGFYDRLLQGQGAGGLQPAALYKKAWSLLRLGRQNEALPVFQRAIDAGAEGDVLLDCKLQVATALLGESKPAEAAALLKPLLGGELQGELGARVMIVLGEACLQVGDDATAKAAFQKMLAGSPEAPLAPRALLGLGIILRKEKNYAEAQARLSAAAEKSTGEQAAHARFELAECLREQGKTAEAVEEYLRVVILGNVPAWGAAAQYRVGECQEALGDKDKAKAAYQAVLKDFAGQTEWVQRAQERLQALQ
jgi:TolA-binding protein